MYTCNYIILLFRNIHTCVLRMKSVHEQPSFVANAASLLCTIRQTCHDCVYRSFRARYPAPFFFCQHPQQLSQFMSITRRDVSCFVHGICHHAELQDSWLLVDVLYIIMEDDRRQRQTSSSASNGSLLSTASSCFCISSFHFLERVMSHFKLYLILFLWTIYLNKICKIAS